MFALSSSVVILSLLAISECVPLYGGGGSEYGGSSGGSSGGGYGESHDEDYHHHEPKPYAFGYSVKDFKKGTNFNQHESSDGHNVKGQYAVALPDGRMQIVSYNADWKDGYHADVKYVGEAHHPEIYASHEGIHDSGSSLGGSGGYEYGGGHASSTNFQSLGGGHHASFGSSGGYGSSQGY